MGVVDPVIASTCLARHACRQHNVLCSTACPLHIELTYQLRMSGIPDEYVDQVVERLPPDRENLDTLRAFAAVAAERKPKNGLYLYSPGSGNGKTEAACAIAQSFIVARSKAAIASGRSAGHLVQFVNTTDLLDLLRRAMDDDVEYERARALMRRIESAELVVLDDVGSEKPSAWVEERFYAMINGIWTRRTSQTLVMTSNASLQSLEMRLGARVRSRVEGLTILVEFGGSDKRRKG